MSSKRHIVALVVFVSIVLIASIRASGVPATDLFTEDLATGEFASARLLGEPADVVEEFTRAVGEPREVAEPTDEAPAQALDEDLASLAAPLLDTGDPPPDPDASNQVVVYDVATSSSTPETIAAPPAQSDTGEVTPAIDVAAADPAAPPVVSSAPSAQPTLRADAPVLEPEEQRNQTVVSPTSESPAAAPTSESRVAAPTTQPTPARAVSSTTTVAPQRTIPASPVPSPIQPWCTIEVSADNGVIVWEDGGRTAVFRRNDVWFHTPDQEARAVLIAEPVPTGDNYVLRLWDDHGSSQDVVCSRINLAATATTTTTVRPTTTTTTVRPTTTTIAPVDPGRLPAPIGVPGGRVQMGFNADLWGQDRTDYWNELEEVPGNGRLIAHEFKSFSKAINMSLFRWHMDQGRDLLLTWNGTDATAILNGSQDEWIREHARQLKTLPNTVMLRFWHEPDVSYKSHWIDHDPQQFIDSWMHVRSLFVEEGAVDNIEWVWCPTAWNWARQGARFYPGDANVDWICADGYSGWDHNKPLPPVEDAYIDFQAWADQHPSKPILVAEFGATERGPGERAEWVRGIPSWVNASPNIRAVVYFDYDRRPNGEDYDWRLRTEPDAWQAMKDVLSSRPFG